MVKIVRSIEEISIAIDHLINLHTAIKGHLTPKLSFDSILPFPDVDEQIIINNLKIQVNEFAQQIVEICESLEKPLLSQFKLKLIESLNKLGAIEEFKALKVYLFVLIAPEFHSRIRIQYGSIVKEITVTEYDVTKGSGVGKFYESDFRRHRCISFGFGSILEYL